MKRALWLTLATALVACSESADPPAPTSSGTAGAGAGSAGSAAGDASSQAGGGGALSGMAGMIQGGAGVGGTSGNGGAAATAGGAGGTSGNGGTSSNGGMAGTAGAPPMVPITHHVMAIEYPGRLVELSAQGQKLWEHQTPSLAVMFTVLPNGHVFYPHGGAKRGAQEVDRDHQLIWSYESAAGELLGGERLANGNTLLGEGGPAQALELDPAKKVVRGIAISTTETAAHGQVRHLHRLPSGNVLLALEGEGVAREMDASGKTVWEYPGVSRIHEAIRLASGNTLIGGGDSKRVLEVTPSGQIAWEFGEKDAPELGLAYVTSVQVLKNGDLLVGNWLGAEGGKGVHAFQVTRDKHVVWKLDDHVLLKSATMVTALDD